MEEDQPVAREVEEELWRVPPHPAKGSLDQMRRDPAIDEYLAGVNPSSRALLQKLRKTILSIVPEVEECISYGTPAFR